MVILFRGNNGGYYLYKGLEHYFPGFPCGTTPYYFGINRIHLVNPSERRTALAISGGINP